MTNLQIFKLSGEPAVKTGGDSFGFAFYGGAIRRAQAISSANEPLLIRDVHNPDIGTIAIVLNQRVYAIAHKWDEPIVGADDAFSERTYEESLELIAGERDAPAHDPPAYG